MNGKRYNKEGKLEFKIKEGNGKVKEYTVLDGFNGK